MSNATRKEHLLVVGNDEALCNAITETLEEASGYTVTRSATFEDALSEILLTNFDLIVTQAELPDLSGMDLLAVVGGLRPNARVVVIDDDLSPKSAVAVYRLGAVDYLYKPLNMSFFLMQIERQLASQRAAKYDQQPKESDNADRDNALQARARRLDPTTRSAALVLRREHFEKINHELTRLLNHVKASFVGLVDADGNMVGAAGTLEDYDLQLLSQALNIDHNKQHSLASILEENKFHSTYFEGDKSGVYIIEFGTPYIVSLAVICGADVKPGMVWLYSKRTANMIDSIFESIPQPKQLPRLGN
ncbi:MAG: response regulator [Chloroflexota bacterium]